MSIIEKLVALQEQDCRIRDMEREMRDIPARKERELSRLEEHKRNVANAEQNLKLGQADIKKLEVETESSREKIVKLRQQQFEIKTNREFKAIESEIEGIQAGIRKLEDQELELMMKAEQGKAELDASRKALTEEDRAVQGDVRVWDERAAALAAEIEEARGVRKEDAAGIDSEWLEAYERIFARKDRALVPVEDGVCGGCHMQLPPFLIHDARKRAALVSCTYCGRLLY